MSFARGLRAVLLGHSYMDQAVVAASSNRPKERATGTVMWATPQDMDFLMSLIPIFSPQYPLMICSVEWRVCKPVPKFAAI
jgi:hypothetical protein